MIWEGASGAVKGMVNWGGGDSIYRTMEKPPSMSREDYPGSSIGRSLVHISKPSPVPCKHTQWIYHFSRFAKFDGLLLGCKDLKRR